jgi:hypothetical protein
LRREPLFIAQAGELFHEVTNGEVRGIALRLVAEFFAVTERLDIRTLHRARVVADALECRGDELVMGHR